MRATRILAPVRAMGPAHALVAAALLSFSGGVHANAEDARWEALRTQLYADRAIADGKGVIEMEAPYRAHDAAVVPIDIRAAFPQSAERYVKTVTLLIDMNPAPMAGRFHFTPASGVANVSTRVRVNAYTNVRAVAETNDGKLYMVSNYVKASGGCSAPGGKDQDAALARLGKMKLRQSPVAHFGEPNQVRLLISHPNNTGMQMDQVSRHYVPAHFIKNIDVSYQGESVLRVESDISLSEDPSLQFFYVPPGPGELTVEVTDSKGGVFRNQWQVAGDS